MPEWRWEPLTKRWTILAGERAGRPSDIGQFHPELPQSMGCPFCEGAEASTPHEISAVRRNGFPPNGPGWSIRVVPNKYPALVPGGRAEAFGERLYRRMPGVGVHEVIVETPVHDQNLADLPIEQMRLVMRAYGQRGRAHMVGGQWRSVVLFRNSGGLAGASLAHPHTQLVASSVVQKRLGEEMESARAYRKETGACIYCDMLKEEGRARTRIIQENDHFVAIVPFASRGPYETWIFPKDHHAQFFSMLDDDLDRFALFFQQWFQRVKVALNDPPYNVALHTAPFDAEEDHVMHWHFECLPRLAELGGYEWGTECFMHPIYPEDAAERLRGVKLL